MKRRIVATILFGLVVGACSDAASSDVGVSLYEWGIDVTSTQLEAGVVTVTMENTGEFPHTLIVTAADGRVVAASDLLQPGASAELPVAMEPGVYEFTCRIVVEGADSLVDHYERGMVSEVTVGS